MHNSGYAANNVNNVGRRYKLFNFSLLRGNYQVINGQIIFRDYDRMGDQKPGYLPDASSGKRFQKKRHSLWKSAFFGCGASPDE